MAIHSPSLLAARAPATAGVAALLRQQVRSGGFAVGDALPPERQLAQSIGVARGTIRAALQQLQNEGVIGVDGVRRRVRTIPRNGSGILSGTVGVVTVRRPNTVTHVAPGWESFVEVGAMQQAREHDLNSLILDVNSLKAPGAVEELLERPPHGIVVVSAAYRSGGVIELLVRLRDAGLPIVTEGDPIGGEEYDRVVSDHEAGAAMLTRFLLQRGRRRIVYCLPASPANAYWVRHRLAGYRAAMAEAGAQPLAPSMQGAISYGNDAHHFEIGVMQMLGYLVDYQRQHGGFDAVMCASDAQVPHVAAALRKLGLKPQDDVLITGYDNFWEDLAERRWEPTPPLATADKQNVEIGKRLVKLLMAGGGAAEPRVERIEPCLVEVTSKS